MARIPPLFATLAAQLVPGNEAVRLLPAGSFRASDGSGRPKDAPGWRVDADLAARLIDKVGARVSRPVVDYEHQTLLAAQNGQAAPAAGWIDALEWRDDDGVYGRIQWTERAAAMIAAGEYRYISPVFRYAPDGAVLDLLHAGLTNHPGLDGLTDLAALSALLPTETDSMEDLKERLCMMLNLPITTTDEELIAELDKLKEMLAGEGAASLAAWIEARDGQIAALKAAEPDPAAWVPLAAHAELQNSLAALTARMEQTERDDLVETALSDGRILPAQEAYWRAQPITALKAWLDVAQPIAALKGTQTGGQPPEAPDASLPAAARCKAEWDKSAALQAEFGDLAAYVAYTKATEAGLAKVHARKE